MDFGSLQFRLSVRPRNFLGLAAAALLLSGCSGAFDFLDGIGGSSGNKDRLPGERISVLTLEQRLEADPKLADLSVQLPRPYQNQSWPQAGGYSSHAMHHLAVPENPRRAWRADAGDGSGGNTRLTSTPVVAGGIAYVLDSEAQISAFDTNTGKRVWRRDLTPRKERSEAGFGGGVAYDGERVFVSTGFGNVHALDAKSGAEIWKREIGIPFRAAPTVDGGRVFVSTSDNQLQVLAVDDGRILWNHRGISETAGLLGSASAAVSGDLVVVPYTSGEIYAFRVQNGQMVWTDSLTRTGNLTSLTALNDIAGRPVIDRDRVLAISHSGRMVAIDLRTGQRVWTRNIGGVQTPWVAGDFVYVVSTNAEVVCISRRDGRIRWITRLPRFEDEEDREDPIEWSGPVLAGNRLIVLSSDGYALSISPYSGEVLSSIEMPDGTFIPPIVADGTIYILTDDADLIAMR
jgi:outer membrane protein assembly factor BamB